MKSYDDITDYSEFTEVSGKPITQDQLYRMRHRYSWAKELVNNDKIGLNFAVIWTRIKNSFRNRINYMLLTLRNL